MSCNSGGVRQTFDYFVPLLGNTNTSLYFFPGTHTLKFIGLNPLGGDHTAFIDNVRINGAPKPGYATQGLLTDQLGTPRIVVDESGGSASVKRHDYLPFGEELSANIGGRTTGQGYPGTDGLRQHFTSYELDAESGLNFAQAAVSIECPRAIYERRSARL